MTFRDHFSTIAGEYAQYRPTYPDALFAWLADLTPDRRLAWDGASGSGQSGRGLEPYFEQVIATDASLAQLSAAEPVPRVHRAAALSEAAPLRSGSIALATTAQALHWLDIPRYFAEVRRVLIPGGAIAAWGYSLARIGPGIDEEVDRFYSDVVGPYWPPQRRIIEDGYRSIPFPFAEIEPPPFEMTAAMTLDAFAGYLGTWSATIRYRRAEGTDPVPPLVAQIEAEWGDETRTVRWPLVMRVGRR